MSDMTRWDQARRSAVEAASRLPRATPEQVPVAEALSRVLAADVVAPVDLPPAPCSAMDGWAVSGPGPWRVRGGRVLAGSLGEALAAGEAVEIATGAWLPEGATAVLRRERARLLLAEDAGVVADDDRDDAVVLAATGSDPAVGADVRRGGTEAAGGEVLVPRGTPVTPAVVGLACAAGLDALVVAPRPEVELLVLGDELLDRGVPRDGRTRDALGPSLPGWVAAYGGRGGPPHRVPDVAEDLRARLEATRAPVVLTTGGTAAGPVDHLHGALDALGAEWLVDGVAVRPGHPMLLARLPDDRLLVGLPGNPLAAVSGVLTLLVPVLDALTGRVREAGRVRLAVALTGHPEDVRLVPVRGGHPSLHAGPSMLRGLAHADAVAVVPPGGAERGADLEALPLPWG